MEKSDKIKIELAKAEASRLNNGLKYLLESHLSTPESVINTPDESIKDISAVIAWQANLLKAID